MLTGTPPTEVAKSVPWSRLKPRRKYWLALPSPACWVTISPGTISSASPGRRMGSAARRWLDTTPSLAAVAIPSRFSARARTSTAVSSAGPCAPASPEASTRHEQIKVFAGRIAQNAGCPASNAILFIDAGSLAARFVPLPTQECVGAAMRMEHAGH